MTNFLVADYKNMNSAKAQWETVTGEFIPTYPGDIEILKRKVSFWFKEMNNDIDAAFEKNGYGDMPNWVKRTTMVMIFVGPLLLALFMTLCLTHKTEKPTSSKLDEVKAAPKE